MDHTHPLAGKAKDADQKFAQDVWCSSFNLVFRTHGSVGGHEIGDTRYSFRISSRTALRSAPVGVPEKITIHVLGRFAAQMR